MLFINHYSFRSNSFYLKPCYDRKTIYILIYFKNICISAVSKRKITHSKFRIKLRCKRSHFRYLQKRDIKSKFKINPKTIVLNFSFLPTHT